MGEIYSQKELETTVERLKAEGKTIVFTNGCFDILHAGHVVYLSKAKKLGDVLVLGLNSDTSVRAIKGNGRPINSENERALVVAALNAVDFVTLFEESTPLKLIERLKPHILVKGGDWNKESVVGRECVESAGGEVVIISFVEGFSTTDTIDKIRKRLANSA